MLVLVPVILLLCALLYFLSVDDNNSDTTKYLAKSLEKFSPSFRLSWLRYILIYVITVPRDSQGCYMYNVFEEKTETKIFSC